jgi:DNA-binding response OmpR family regulator
MRLLLIEDNRRLADCLATALQNGGFAIDHVTTTTDADGALATAHYDSLLLDLGLPYADGLVLLGQQRRCQMTKPGTGAHGDRQLGGFGGRLRSGRR